MKALNGQHSVFTTTVILTSFLALPVPIRGCSSLIRISTAPNGVMQTIKSYSFTPPNEDSCWIVDSLAAIQFKLLHFEVPDNTDCNNAWLTIYDGSTTHGKVVAYFCKNSGPGRELYFTGKYGLVRFQTGSNYTNGGFALRYSQASSFYLSKQRLFYPSNSSSVKSSTSSIFSTTQLHLIAAANVLAIVSSNHQLAQAFFRCNTCNA